MIENSRKALVTLAIGSRHFDAWNNVARKGWTAYCERHGYDLIVFDQPLDTSARAAARSPAWQKCLVLGQDRMKDYDRVVWLDSDVLVNPLAPSIVEGVPPEKIGATDELTYPTVAEHQAVVRALVTNPQDLDIGNAELYHTRVGLPGGQRHIIQTGVLVLSPAHHRKLLERVYEDYDDAGPALFYEMRFLSHEIQRQALAHWLDKRFNALVLWLFQANCVRSGTRPTDAELRFFLTEQYLRNYFLHFAGCLQMMGYVADLFAS